MNSVIKFCESWGIPVEYDEEKYGNDKCVVNDKLFVSKINFTARYSVRLKGQCDELNKYGQIYGVIDLIKEHNPEYFEAYKNRVCYIPDYFGPEKDLGVHHCETSIEWRKEKMDKYISKNGSFSLFDERGLYKYYDSEYEEPDKDTFERCYKDSCIGWESSDGFEIKLTTDSSHGVVACLYYPETKEINSKYKDWKDIARLYFNDQIYQHERAIENLNEEMNNLLKEE